MSGIAALTVLALALSACGGGGSDPSPSPSAPESSASATESTPSETPSATPTVDPTMLTDLAGIEVSTDLAAAPVVTAPYPFAVESTMDKVIVQGEGLAVPSAESIVQVQYTGINARTGEEFDSSWMRGAPTDFPLANLIPGFAKGVVGKQVGSRVAIAIPSQDGYGANGNAEAGILPDDTLLFIVDILETQLAGPTGETVTPPEGLPVVSETDGVPSITIPDGLAEPTAVVAQPLIQGTGTELTEIAGLVSYAVCSTWDGTEVYNDYDGAAALDDRSSGVHQALFTALLGQKNGSRVLVVLPGEIAYPNGNPEPSIAPNTALACVVDLLYVQV